MNCKTNDRTCCEHDLLHKILDAIKKSEDRIMADINELDAQIAVDVATITTAIGVIQALVEKIGNTPGAPDFTNEIKALSDINVALQAAVDAANVVLNPPANP